MAEIKYQYAYDENGNLISIEECTKESCEGHTYRCVGCGNTLRPRAIESKYRRAHFYHKEFVECSGETYVHKLAKKLIKSKFEDSDHFFISYQVEKKCSDKTCRLRNMYCQEERSINTIDLKQSYDTCIEEAPINGFVADLLLTNSKNPQVEPLLIEICVTHACEEIKLKSGLKIIEITLKNEQEVLDVVKVGSLKETEMYELASKKETKVQFISFKRKLEVPWASEVTRYIFTQSTNKDGHITHVPCDEAAFKLVKDSYCELNIVNVKSSPNLLQQTAMAWMAKNKNLRRCDVCKFYYTATNDNGKPICHLNKQYGKPECPKMTEAETCSGYCMSNSLPEFHRTYIEEVTEAPIHNKDTFRVIIAGSKSFDNYHLFKKKCDYYLKSKLATHQVIVVSRTSWKTSCMIDMIEEYARDRELIVEHYEVDWEKYGKRAAYVSEDEMLSHADALIAFSDGIGTNTGYLIKEAKAKGIKVGDVKY